MSTVKAAQPGVCVGHARHPSFTVSTITSKAVVYAPADRADTLPIFLLYPYMYSVGSTQPHPTGSQNCGLLPRCPPHVLLQGELIID
jgi:hypothetical protein